MAIPERTLEAHSTACFVQVVQIFSPSPLIFYISAMCIQRCGIPGADVPWAFRGKRDEIYYALEGLGRFQQYQDISGDRRRDRSSNGAHVRYPTSLPNLANEPESR